MRTRYGVSPWIENVPGPRRPDYPRARGQFAADVVILGGGLTGCATAHAAAASGLKTILVEAERIGQAGAGRSAGLLLPDPGPSFRDVTSSQGLRLARRIFEAWRLASLDAAAQMRRLKIGCRLQPLGSLLVASAADEARLKKEHLAREEAGLAAPWLTATPIKALTGLDAAAGIRLKDGFAFDPYAACIGVAAAAAKSGGTLFERTPVKTVQVRQKSVVIVCEGGTIEAKTVVVATGSASSEYKPLRRHFTQREAYLALTEPVPASVRKQLGQGDATIEDLQTPRHRLLWTHGGRLLIGGGDQAPAPPRLLDTVLVQRTGQLMYELLLMHPAIAGLRPDFGWNLSYAETADRLMFIGPHRNYPRHLFALGSSGDSLTGAFLAARILTRALHGASEPGDDVLAWGKRLGS
jgi:glycine/D-amino acid oxidase-like deaminating enzyme